MEVTLEDTNNTSKYVTIKHLSDKYGIPENAIKEWCKKDLKRFRVEKRIFLKEKDFLEYLNKYTQ